MGAKILRHPRTGKPLGPKKGRASQRAAQQRAAQRGTQHSQQNHRGYPPGHGPGGYVGTNGQAGDQASGNETVVVCEAPSEKKKKFPWGTVLLTGVVSTAGVIAAYKLYEKFAGEKGGRTTNPEPEGGQQALLNARDYLLLSAPGAEHAINRIPQQPQIINAGPSQREIDLMERETKLRERMAEMEGFIQGQQAAVQQEDSLTALLNVAEGSD